MNPTKLIEAHNVANRLVDGGAEILDKYVTGWASKINMDELSIKSCNQCVLGQLFGRHHIGHDSLSNLTNDYYTYAKAFTIFGIREGVFESRNAVGEIDDLSNKIMNETWIKAIQARLKGDISANTETTGKATS